MITSPPVKRLLDNLDDIFRLLGMHADVAGDGPGRKHDVGVLNKSCVVLLVACWEAYIEDLACCAFDIFLQNAPKANIFPKRVLIKASKSLRESQNECDIWKIADSGWRQVILDHKQALLDRYIGTLNTPKPAQINSLFDSLLGMPTISKHWHWNGMSHLKAEANLLKLVELRGEIAHRVSTSQVVRKKYVEQNVDFIQYLAAKSHNAVLDHVRLHTKKNELMIEGTSWLRVRYNKIG